MPLALVAAVALFATVLPIWQKRSYAIALMQLAEQVQVQADSSDALRRRLEQLTGDHDFPLQRKYAFPAAVQVVEEVTKLLPDDTWLTQFELKTTTKGKDSRRELLLRGESGNAGHLVSLLEESNLFEEAAPRSPTMKIQPGPGEIFALGAQLKSLPLPQPVQVAGEPGANISPPAVPDVAPSALPLHATTPARAAVGALKPSGAPDEAQLTRSGSSDAGAPAAPHSAPGAPSPDIPDDY